MRIGALKFGSPHRRGAALILVVVVIAALLAIAAPFVISMRLQEKSSRAFAAQIKAKQTADGARNQALTTLRRSHEDEERRAREASGTRLGDEEGVDGFDEIGAAGPREVQGKGLFEVANPKGPMAQVTAKDVRGRLDLNTSGPDALANLLGATTLRETLSYREKDELFLSDVFPFLHSSDGDPETIDGFVRIRGEYIAYRHVNPRTGALQGLVRGFLFSRGEEPEDGTQAREFHAAGSLVQDGRGHKLAYDPLWRYMGTDRQGRLARFDSTAGVRRIADWEFASLRAALVLFRYGVNMRLLRQWGVAGDDLLGAGIHPGDFEVDEAIAAGESAEERREREGIERQLEIWGVPVDFAKRFGGARALKRIHERLVSLDSAQREKQIERFKQREDSLAENLKRVEGWLKDETKRQLSSLSEMRNSAPHLETIGRIELEERVRPYVTVDATPEGEAWSDPQTVNHDVDFKPYGFTSDMKIHDARRFNSGWIVKIQPRQLSAEDAPRDPEYRMCVGVKGEQVSVFPQLDFDYQTNELEISCRQPRPVNVNTASREVLVAIMTGLQSRAGQKARAVGGVAPNIVTPEQAAAVAEAIVTRDTPLETPLDLRGLLFRLRQSDAIDDHDLDAIWRNAIDPADPLLSRSTVPFAYRSGDVYELEVTGIQNDPAGNELARYGFREVVRAVPPRPLVWRIDSQADFTDRVYLAGRPQRRRERGLSYPGVLPWLSLPGRFGSLTQTWPVPLGPFEANPYRWPSRSHDPGEGDLLPLLAREPDLVAQGSTVEPTWGNLGQSGPQPGGLAPHAPSRWDDQPDGEDLATISLDAASGQVPTRWFQLENGQGRASLGPGLIRGWFRFDTIEPAAKQFLFDGGESDTRERISLYIQGRSRMVLEVYDGSLDLQESGGTKRSIRLEWNRTDAGFQARRWYHVAAFFKGADRGDLALAVDGEFVGQETHGSRLAQPLDRYGMSLEVEDASGFPRSGWVRVGGSRWAVTPSAAERGIWNTALDANSQCEVLHYNDIRGNTLLLSDSAETINGPNRGLPAGTTLSGANDLDAQGGQQALGQFPARARVPRRGSGHRVQFQTTRLNQQGQTVPAGNWIEMFGYEHDTGTLVVPFGYSSWLKNEAGAGAPTAIPGIQTTGYQENLRVGGATLLQPLPRNTPYTLAWLDVPYNPQNPTPVVIAAGDTEVPAIWLEPFQTERPTPVNGTDPNIIPVVRGGFPPFGIIRIDQERIFYGGIDSSNGRFLNCVRGVEGTTPAAHTLFAPIVLETIQVSDLRDYPRRAAASDPRVYISLTSGTPGPAGPGGAPGVTEWISVQDCADPALASRGLWLIPANDTLEPLPRCWYENELQTMRINKQLVGLNPGGTTPVPPAPTPPNPIPQGYQPPYWSNFSGTPIKEVLKRIEPSTAQPISIRFQGRTIQLPIEGGSRVAKGTTRPDPLTGHVAGTRICPTFVVRLEDGNIQLYQVRPEDGCEAGPGDVVTVTDTAGGPEERRVAHSSFGLRVSANALAIAQQLGLVVPPGDQASGWLIAFDAFVSRPFLAANDARLLRWPTGNLQRVPNLAFGRVRDPSNPSDVPGDAPGLLPGRVDDFVVEQLVIRDNDTIQTRFTTALSPGDGAVTATGANAQVYERGRLFRSDGEVLAVVGANRVRGGADLTLARGVLRTAPAPISRETALWRLQWPPHAIAGGGFSGPGNNVIPAQQPNGDYKFRSETEGGGYLRADRGPNLEPSMHPYLRLSGGRGGSRFERPIDRWGRGTFSGSFGAADDAPGPNALLTDQPFRHHDRYRDRTSSVEGVFLQVSKEIPGGFVEHVKWQELRPTPYGRVRVAVRIDGGPNWDAPPVPTGQSALPGRLYQFDDPGGPNRIDLPATRIEVRIYLRFDAQGWRDDGWKDGAVLKGLQVHYRQAARSLRREERTE